MCHPEPCSRTLLPLPQSDAYGQAAAACGAQVSRADLGCGAALVVQRGRMRLISRGPVWHEGATDRDQRRAVRRFARWPGLTLVTSETPFGGPGLIPLVTPMHQAIWDLAGDLRGGMAGKWRNRLVAAERAGVVVMRGGSAILTDLLQAEARQRLTRRYHAHSAEFTLALPEQAFRLWQWRDGGELAAAMAFIRHGTSASYHLGWASERARRRGAHGVMLTRAAEALRAEGVRWLDLGSVNSAAAPGLARFKLGTGAALRRLGATVLVVPG